ncbi:MAG: PAS domain-containing protein [Sphingobacterium sp.]|nr:PAS domain-containing protein [Sphingobacterium sp.]
MAEGFALYELLDDDRGRPADWWVIEVNAAYTRHTGVAREQILGRRISEVFPAAVQEYLPLRPRRRNGRAPGFRNPRPGGGPVSARCLVPCGRAPVRQHHRGYHRTPAGRNRPPRKRGALPGPVQQHDRGLRPARNYH